MRVAGLLLAAGAGRRFGAPKALVRDDDGTSWVRRRTWTLLDGGCSPVLVVTGAAASDVAGEVAAMGVTAVHAIGWDEGMGVSLRTGLEALAALERRPAAVLVALVDTPGLTPAVVSRLRRRGADDALARAAYAGVPGHPVLLGSQHWEGVREAASGDRGARDYLRRREVVLVECADVGSGEDVDLPEEDRQSW